MKLAPTCRLGDFWVGVSFEVGQVALFTNKLEANMLQLVAMTFRLICFQKLRVQIPVEWWQFNFFFLLKNKSYNAPLHRHWRWAEQSSYLQLNFFPWLDPGHLYCPRDLLSMNIPCWQEWNVFRSDLTPINTLSLSISKLGNSSVEGAGAQLRQCPHIIIMTSIAWILVHFTLV